MSDQPPAGTPPTPPPAPPPSGGTPGGGGAASGGTDPRSGLPYATFGDRAIAAIIDWAIFVAAGVVLLIIVTILGFIADILGLLVGIVAYVAFFVAAIGYFVISDGGPLGQTFGKHIKGIKVVGPTPGPIGLGKAGIRYIGRILNTIVCGIPIGYLWPLFDAEQRGWHDMIADTRVVVAPQGEKSFNTWMNNVR